MFDHDQIKALSAPLNREHVKSRSQAGRSLSYIEGWHAIAEANRIFGYDAWDRELRDLTLLGEPRLVDGKHRVGYRATVRVTVKVGERTIIRDGSGFGSGIDKDVDQAHESALKEAETDAMKRALMTFGNPFGLALYDKEQKDVASAPKQPAPQPKKADPADFWARDSYAFNAPTMEKWVEAFEKGMAGAPTIAAANKMAGDNDGHLKALPEALYARCADALRDRLAALSQTPAGAAA